MNIHTLFVLKWFRIHKNKDKENKLKKGQNNNLYF